MCTVVSEGSPNDTVLTWLLLTVMSSLETLLLTLQMSHVLLLLLLLLERIYTSATANGLYVLYAFKCL